jgi:predicted GNAT family acetyltransferase
MFPLGKLRADGSGRPFRPVYRYPTKSRKGRRISSTGMSLTMLACHVGSPYLLHENRSLADGTLQEHKQNEDMTMTVRDNKERQRFELDIEGSIAFANYRVTPDAVIITHTETPSPLRGRGVASELVKGALELIRADGRKVIAGCSFVVDYLHRHPEYTEIVA